MSEHGKNIKDDRARETYEKALCPADEAVADIKDGDRVWVGVVTGVCYELSAALWRRRAELSAVTAAFANCVWPTPLLWGEAAFSDGRNAGGQATLGASAAGQAAPGVAAVGASAAGRPEASIASAGAASGDAANPFKVHSYFLGNGERYAARKLGMPLDFTSAHLSNNDRYALKVLRPSVVFLNLSLPDERGYCSYGASGGSTNRYMVEAVRKNGGKIIAQINPNMPRVLGRSEAQVLSGARGPKDRPEESAAELGLRDMFIHVSELDRIVEVPSEGNELPELPGLPFDEKLQKISSHILELVPDGATLQLGLGGLSTAIGHGLLSKNELGIHSELMSDPLMELIKNGNVTNTKKGLLDGVSIFSFALGTRALYDFLDNNEEIICAPYTYVNDPRVVMQNKNMISINTAMAIDLYGQVAADAVGYSQYSAVGGQVDFVRGAQWSEGGKSIIACNSYFIDKAGKKRSKIVMNFDEGTPVTTPRSDVQYVCTEYGIADLSALSMKDRARALIELADPDFRDELRDSAGEKGLI